MLFVANALLVLGSPAFGEEAELVPERDLRITLSPAAGIQIGEWEKLTGGKTTLFNIGAGLEYGVRDWVSAQVLWLPGVNVWSTMEDDMRYGYFSDMFLGGKVGILGSRALIKRDDMRLSAAVGIRAPFPSKDGADREGDHHLWGTALRIYYDYIFTRLFYLNGYAEGVYYPEQMAHTPNFSEGAVDHPLDFTVELEPRFRYELPAAGMELHWGMPLKYRMAPWINREGIDFEQEMMHRFSLGVFFRVAFVGMDFPFDIAVRYEAPAAGMNEQPLHEVGLTGRVSFGLGKGAASP
jgi:hypothetical protein